MAAFTVPGMRKFLARIVLLIAGTGLAVLCVPAALFWLLAAAMNGQSVRQEWARAKITLSELFLDWLELFLDPVDDGENSGI
jgi:hypothetical protein